MLVCRSGIRHIFVAMNKSASSDEQPQNMHQCSERNGRGYAPSWTYIAPAFCVGLLAASTAATLVCVPNRATRSCAAANTFAACCRWNNPPPSLHSAPILTWVDDPAWVADTGRIQAFRKLFSSLSSCNKAALFHRIRWQDEFARGERSFPKLRVC